MVGIPVLPSDLRPILVPPHAHVCPSAVDGVPEVELREADVVSQDGSEQRIGGVALHEPVQLGMIDEDLPVVA